ncbi:hypothetical protein PENTCL1PPCAC_19911, partial [Pristionchus entomophagus]
LSISRMKFTFLILFSSLVLVSHATQQTVGVRGTLFCGNKPLAHAEVKLWDLDIWTDPDDQLATVRTDRYGNFVIYGTEDEIFTFDPVVKIIYSCDNKNVFGLEKINDQCSLRLDMGVMNMEPSVKGEQTKCF